MTEETLGATQQFLKNYVLNWFATVGRHLAYTIDDEFYGLGSNGYQQSIRPGIARLTLEQVNAAIRRHLQYDNMYIVFITSDAEAMKRKILSGEPTPITYNSEQSAEHMAEDKLIASFPIPVQEENITIMGIDDVFERR